MDSPAASGSSRRGRGEGNPHAHYTLHVTYPTLRITHYRSHLTNRPRIRTYYTGTITNTYTHILTETLTHLRTRMCRSWKTSRLWQIVQLKWSGKGCGQQTCRSAYVRIRTSWCTHNVVLWRHRDLSTFFLYYVHCRPFPPLPPASVCFPRVCRINLLLKDQGPKILQSERPAYKCTCSDDRVFRTLALLPVREIIQVRHRESDNLNVSQA